MQNEDKSDKWSFHLITVEPIQKGDTTNGCFDTSMMGEGGKNCR